MGLLFLLPLQAGGRNEFTPHPHHCRGTWFGMGVVWDAAGGSLPVVPVSEAEGYS